MLSNTQNQLNEMGMGDRFFDVMDEMPRVREDLGFPPLVTPTSQIVGTMAMMNVMMGDRYKMVPNEVKDLVRGKYGKLPGTVSEETRRTIIEDEEPNSVMFVSTNKAGDEIIRIMNETRLPRFHEPKAPRFVLTDRQGKFALGIGGYVRATAEYDFGGIVKDVDFYPALIGRPGKGNFAKTSSKWISLLLPCFSNW